MIMHVAIIFEGTMKRVEIEDPNEQERIMEWFLQHNPVETSGLINGDAHTKEELDASFIPYEREGETGRGQTRPY